jgi:hypothetical protein
MLAFLDINGMLERPKIVISIIIDTIVLIYEITARAGIILPQISLLWRQND